MFLFFNMDTEEWQHIIENDSQRPPARQRAAMVCLHESLYLFGGYSEDDELFFSDMWRYDIAKKQWHVITETMNKEMQCIHAMACQDGIFALVCDQAQTKYETIMFDCTTNQWNGYSIANLSQMQPLVSTFSYRTPIVTIAGGFPKMLLLNPYELYIIDVLHKHLLVVPTTIVTPIAVYADSTKLHILDAQQVTHIVHVPQLGTESKFVGFGDVEIKFAD